MCVAVHEQTIICTPTTTSYDVLTGTYTESDGLKQNFLERIILKEGDSIYPLLFSYDIDRDIQKDRTSSQ